MTHELKLWAPFYNDVLTEIKKFELRRNDRNFKVGDFLHLREWDNVEGKYTGREMKVQVSYILAGPLAEAFGLQPGFCIMSIEFRNIIKP